MKKLRVLKGFLIVFLGFYLTGCEKSEREFNTFGKDTRGQPLQFRYLSSNVVELMVAGQSYKLDRRGPRIRTPFRYRFEDDGDIDIVFQGKAYDLDSPYDIDIKTKKTSKKKVTKKSKSSKKKKSKKKKKSSKK